MTDPFASLLRQLQYGDVLLGLAILLLASCFACYTLRLFTDAARTKWVERYGRFSWQLGCLLALEQAYEFTRARIPHESNVALTNAYRLLNLEWRHGLFVESRIERFFLRYHPLMNAIDVFYVFSHILVTLAVLVWIFTKRGQYYPLVRNLFIVTTALALVSFYLYPTAPPRMLGNYGFVDPLQLHHIVGAGGEQPGSYTYNPYAAMPSLHVAYALIAGFAVFVAERRWLVRCLAVIYPCAMAAAVVISGNHWVLDVVGAFVAVVLSGLLLLILSGAYRFIQHRLPDSLLPVRLRLNAEQLP